MTISSIHNTTAIIIIITMINAVVITKFACELLAEKSLTCDFVILSFDAIILSAILSTAVPYLPSVLFASSSAVIASVEAISRISLTFFSYVR